MTLSEHINESLTQGATVINLTHGPGCPDGATSAALVRRAYGDKVCLIYAQPPKLDKILKTIRITLKEQEKELALLITDLGLNDGTTDNVIEELEKLPDNIHVYWLDHHAPSWDAGVAARIRNRCEHLTIDRTGKDSGATLTRAFLAETNKKTHPGLWHPKQGMKNKELVKYTEKIALRDTWTDPHDYEAICLGLAYWQLKDEYLDKFANQEFKDLLEIGATEYYKNKEQVLRNLSKIQHYGRNVAYLFGPANISDTADAYWSAGYAKILLHVTPKGVCSLRSHPDYPIAADFARSHDGGGHKHAAGFSINTEPGWKNKLARWWLNARQEKHKQFHQLLREAEEAVEKYEQEQKHA